MTTVHTVPADFRLVSFVIPTRNRAELLEKTIRSILRQRCPDVRIEIFVVDNQSVDDTASRVAALAESADFPVRLAPMPENRGPARSRNYGASLCSGEYVAFVDSDVELDDRWLLNVLESFKLCSGVAMVAGKVVFASSPSIIHCYGGELSHLGLGWDAHQGEEETSLGRGEFRLWVPSASVIVLRSAFEQVGGFDEAFFYGYEDSDLGWRLNMAGWHCYLTPHAIAAHAMTDQIDDRVRKVGSEIVFHYSKNRIRSMLKNCGHGGFWCWIPASIVYSIVDLLLRKPRRARFRALMWNLKMLPDTLAARTRVQQMRREPDAVLRGLFAGRLFPPQTLERRLRERSQLHGSRRPNPRPSAEVEEMKT